MAHLKAWAISTHSVRQLELSPKLFDLVVIDEASQCSIPSVLPLLFRAKRALIIGDPMQLGHIPGISPEQERQARVRAGPTAPHSAPHRARRAPSPPPRRASSKEGRPSTRSDDEVVVS
ncbi:AAA domain-containing protein [Streptomyces sp. NPDC057748]